MAHIDTMRIGDISAWEKDPLSGAICVGKIYGRGACDDKYAAAAALFVLKLLKENGFKPKKSWKETDFIKEQLFPKHHLDIWV